MYKNSTSNLYSAYSNIKEKGRISCFHHGLCERRNCNEKKIVLDGRRNLGSCQHFVEYFCLTVDPFVKIYSHFSFQT